MESAKSSDVQARIAEARNSDIGYQLCSDEEILRELQIKQDSQISPLAAWHWQEFYGQQFRMQVDLAKIVIPKRREGFERLLVLVPGVTSDRLFQKLKQMGGAWKFVDEGLDEVVTHHDRDANKTGAYAVWLRNRQDQELKNRSANELLAQNIPGITLPEYLVCQITYFLESGGQYLDVNNSTLCSGSRYSCRDVPVATGRDRRGVCVLRCGPALARDDLHAREVSCEF